VSGRSRSGRRRPPARHPGRTRRDPEAARRRQQEQARERSRRRRRRWIIVAGAVGALALTAALLVWLHRPDAEERRLLGQAAPSAQDAGCDEVRPVRPYPGDRDRTHIGGDVPSMPSLSSYPSHPPVSGPHGVGTVPAGVYDDPPPLDGVIHSLEHAAVVIWFAPASSGSPEVERIRRFFARGDQRNHVVVAPYDYPDAGPAGSLEEGQMALAAWHRLRTCARPSLAVAYEFVSRYRFDLYRVWEYRGEAPERWFTPI
jgi:hypothetical protein